MGINPGSTKKYFWNYSNPSKEGYSLMLVGTVKFIQEVQARVYNPNSATPGTPRFWPDGNPVMNHRIILVDDHGEIKTFTYQPAGKLAKEGKKPSVHMDLWRLSGGSMNNLIGKTIFIKTQEGHYGQGNPRPWEVGFADEGYGPFETNEPMPEEFTVPYLLCNEAAHGGQVQPQQQQPRQAPVQYAQPQPAYQQQPQYQPVTPTVTQPQPAYNQQPYYTQPYQPQPVQAQMNPQIAQQMVSQAFGAPVQVQQPGYDYDADMPF